MVSRVWGGTRVFTCSNFEPVTKDLKLTHFKNYLIIILLCIM